MTVPVCFRLPGFISISPAVKAGFQTPNISDFSFSPCKLRSIQCECAETADSLCPFPRFIFISLSILGDILLSVLTLFYIIITLSKSRVFLCTFVFTFKSYFTSLLAYSSICIYFIPVSAFTVSSPDSLSLE